MTTSYCANVRVEIHVLVRFDSLPRGRGVLYEEFSSYLTEEYYGGMFEMSSRVFDTLFDQLDLKVSCLPFKPHLSIPAWRAHRYPLPRSASLPYPRPFLTLFLLSPLGIPFICFLSFD